MSTIYLETHLNRKTSNRTIKHRNRRNKRKRTSKRKLPIIKRKIRRTRNQLCRKCRRKRRILRRNRRNSHRRIYRKRIFKNNRRIRKIRKRSLKESLFKSLLSKNSNNTSPTSNEQILKSNGLQILWRSTIFRSKNQ